MNSRLRLIPRIALFAALIYVLSWGTSYLPNINLIFFIAFMAGVYWGLVPGILVGGLGMALWTMFNPFGPATFPVMLAQVTGTAFSGAIGAVFARRQFHLTTGRTRIFALVLAATLCTLMFYLPVNLVDAWIFKPFWPRFVGGMLWALISLAGNVVIFPVLFGAATILYNRERTL